MTRTVFLPMVTIVLLAVGAHSTAQKGPERWDVQLEEWSGSEEWRVADLSGSLTLLHSTTYMDLTFTLEDSGRSLCQGEGWSPVIGRNGTVLFVGRDLSLREMNCSGEERLLVAAGGVGGALTASPSKRYLAYAVPQDLRPDETEIGKYGIGIYDMTKAEEIVSYVVPGSLAKPVGWLGDNLVFSESERTRWVPYTTLKLLSVKGDVQPFMDRLPRTTTEIAQSFDRKLLAYQAYDSKDTVLVDLPGRSLSVIPGLERPMWVADGLTGLKDGKRVRVNLTPAP